MATAKGHMHQKRKNIRSNNQQDPMKLEDPPMKPLEQHTNIVFTNIIYHKRQIEILLTDKSPVTSNWGNNYLFLLYEYNINFILISPIKARSDSNFIQVFKDLNEDLLTRRFSTAYMIL